MAKHRRLNTTTRRLATASLVAAGAAVLVPGVANAAVVTVPNTDISFDVPGLENVPHLNSIPNVEQWVPSLQAETHNITPAASTNFTPAAAPAAAPASGQAIVDAARSKVGAPYGWGATGPHSFDCSGLTSWAYQQVGKSIPRTSQAQAAQGTQVAIADLRPGDIVAYYGGASHVAIYAGNGTIIDALNSGSPVAERPLHYMPIHSAVRF